MFGENECGMLETMGGRTEGKGRRANSIFQYERKDVAPPLSFIQFRPEKRKEIQDNFLA